MQVIPLCRLSGYPASKRRIRRGPKCLVIFGQLKRKKFGKAVSSCLWVCPALFYDWLPFWLQFNGLQNSWKFILQLAKPVLHVIYNFVDACVAILFAEIIFMIFFNHYHEQVISAGKIIKRLHLIDKGCVRVIHKDGHLRFAGCFAFCVSAFGLCHFNIPLFLMVCLPPHVQRFQRRPSISLKNKHVITSEPDWKLAFKPHFFQKAQKRQDLCGRLLSYSYNKALFRAIKPDLKKLFPGWQFQFAPPNPPPKIVG